MNESYERQLSNPVAQEGERVERKLWETTLRDGLDEL